MQHPPEPWKAIPCENGLFEIDHSGDGSVGDEFTEEAARRIVACVNHLRYVPTEILEAIVSCDATREEHNQIATDTAVRLKGWVNSNPHLFWPTGEATDETYDYINPMLLRSNIKWSDNA